MSLSGIGEGSVYGQQLEVVEASNETLLLRHSDGRVREYIDLLSAYGAVNFGHCNPEINPFRHFSSDIAACFYPPEAATFCAWIVRYLNLQDYEVLFQVGGSMAVTAALSIAQQKKAGKIAYLKGSFHGLGIDALSITNVHREYALQSALLGITDESKFLCLDYSSDVAPPPEEIAWDEVSCLIYEPVQGANGYIPVPRGWLQAIINKAKEHDVMVIADEIQSGFFRHGSLSVARQAKMNSDIYLFSKSLTNGLYPFSIVLYPTAFRRELKHSFYLAHTFQTSALGCFAMYEVSRFIDSHDIDQMCSNVELELEMFASVLRAQEIERVYVSGPTLSFEAPAGLAKPIVQRCLSKGVLVFSGGPSLNRIRVAPPVTIKLDHLRMALDVLHEALLDQLS